MKEDFYEILSGAKEGYVLLIAEDEIAIDEEETNKRKKEIEEMTKDLWK